MISKRHWWSWETSGIHKKKEDLLPLHKRRGSYLTSTTLIALKTTWTIHATSGQSEFQDKKVRKLIKKNIPETLKRNRIAGGIKIKAETIREGKEKRWRRSKKWERKKINLRRKRKWEWKILSEIPREPR